MIDSREQWWGGPKALSNQPTPDAHRSPVLRSLSMWALLVMLALLPVRAIELPLHMAFVDLWNIVVLSFAWMYLIRTRQHIWLPYGLAIWLVLLGSLIGTFFAPLPSAAITVLVKEVYLFAWFITVAALLASFNAQELRRVLRVWVLVLVLNGALVIAQFLIPPFFQSMIAVVGRFGMLDPYRPSGLFENANSTALFQLMGFAPVLLLGGSWVKTAALCVFLLLSILATGSMAATSGFVCGFALTIGVIATVGGRPRLVIKVVGPILLGAVLLAGLLAFVISQEPAYQQRFEYIFYGRASGSAGGRFILWQRGLELVFSGSTLLGIGPEGFRNFDSSGTQLHNDILSFLVERGVIGTLGLLLLEAQALLKGLRLLLLHRRFPNRIGLAGAILVGVIGAALIHSQFHQVFRDRSIWLVLALQEAMLIHYGAYRLGWRWSGPPEPEQTPTASGATL